MSIAAEFNRSLLPKAYVEHLIIDKSKENLFFNNSLD